MEGANKGFRQFGKNHEYSPFYFQKGHSLGKSTLCPLEPKFQVRPNAAVRQAALLNFESREELPRGEDGNAVVFLQVEQVPVTSDKTVRAKSFGGFKNAIVSFIYTRERCYPLLRMDRG